MKHIPSRLKYGAAALACAAAMAWFIVQQGSAKAPQSPQAKDAPKVAKSVSDVIDFDVSVSPKEIKRGQVTRITVTGMPRKEWHTYAMNVTTPSQATSTFKIGATPGLQPLGPIQETQPVAVAPDAYSSGAWEHNGQFSWVFDVLAKADARVGPLELPFAVKLQVCRDGTGGVCIPGEIPLKARWTVLPGEPLPLSAEITARAGQKFPPAPKEIIPFGSAFKMPEKLAAQLTTPVAPQDIPRDIISPSNQAKVDPFSEEFKAPPQPPTTPTALPAAAPPTTAIAVGVPDDCEASFERISKQIQAPAAKPVEGLMAFVLTGMFWGFVSLITPCVFPMIPITVSFFLKQSEKEHHKPVMMALVYCGTIVVVLTIAAAALLSFFRMLSINPYMNFGLGVLFMAFALSLFGMYDIELPSFLARYTSERENKGGFVGTVFMALTFTIISFACVAPFLGGFGGTAATATQPLWHTLLGGLAYSVTFASPFFILALFPTLLKAMPKSGAWLNSVKVVMGFLELAAAFKFFRGGELLLSASATFFTFDFVLGVWVALCVLCGLYLLGVYRLPLDSPMDHLSVPRLGFSFVFLGLALYLSPALFVKAAEGEQPRPSGVIFAWVNSFLLPEARPAKGEMWTANLEDAIAQARAYRQRTGKAKLVFLDFTGVNCTNCNLNEHDVFTKPEIQSLFKPYVLVKLYTDKIPIQYYSADKQSLAVSSGRQDADAAVIGRFEKKAFDTEQLPLYVILEPQLDNMIKIVGIYDEGRIMNDSAFAAFLRQPQEAIGTTFVASR